MLRKLFTPLLLLLALLLSLFAGCGQRGKASPSLGATEESAASVTDGAGQGTTATDSVSSSNIYPLTEETAELSLMTGIYIPNTGGIINDWSEHPIYLAAEEITNVHIEFTSINTETAADTINTSIAGGDMPDMYAQCLMYSSGGIDYMIEENILINLKDYINTDYMPNLTAIIEEYPDVLKDMSSDTGNVAATYSLQVGENIPNSGLLIRDDLLQELGLEIPQTYEELHATLLALKTAYDIYPLEVYKYGLMSYLYFGMDASLSVSDPGTGISGRAFFQIDDQVQYGFSTEAFRSYITMMNQWYQEGLFSFDLLSYTDVTSLDGATADKLTGGVAVFEASPTRADSYIASSEIEGYTLAAIPNPTQSSETTIKFQTTNRSTLQREAFSITTCCDNPELAVRWIDFWYGEQGCYLANYGIENESYIINSDGSVSWTDLIMNNPDGFTSTVMLYVYTNQFMPCSADLGRTLNMLSNTMASAIEIWSSNIDGEINYQLPTAIALTSEESTELNTIFADIETYITENVIKFIVGERSLEEIDDFQADLQAFGIDTCINIMQSAYDRYLSR